MSTRLASRRTVAHTDCAIGDRSRQTAERVRLRDGSCVAVRPLASAGPVRRICAAWPIDGYQGPTLSAVVDSLRLRGQDIA